MPLTADQLREEAQKARRLAKTVSDPWTFDSLSSYADECEAKAGELDQRADDDPRHASGPRLP